MFFVVAQVYSLSMPLLSAANSQLCSVAGGHISHASAPALKMKGHDEKYECRFARPQDGCVQIEESE
jgi:hypothetical protein